MGGPAGAGGSTGGGETEGARSYVDASHPTSKGVYETQDEVDALGNKGQALFIGGKYSWPVANRRDLLNALAAWKALRPGPTASTVKSWLKEKAIRMRLEELLPANWQQTAPTPIEDLSAARGGWARVFEAFARVPVPGWPRGAAQAGPRRSRARDGAGDRAQPGHGRRGAQARGRLRVQRAPRRVRSVCRPDRRMSQA